MLKTKPINKNSKRSIDILMKQMLKMLKTSKLSEISISQLTMTAGLARNTFYAHFETKEDLLTHYMYTLFNTKVKSIIEESGKQYDDFDLLYFQMWSEHKDFLKLLDDNNLLHLLNRLSFYLDNFCEEYFQDQECTFSQLALPYLNTIYVNLLGSITIKWLNLNFKNTPEELRDIFREIIQ